MEQQQQIDPIAAQATAVALERMSVTLAQQSQQSAMWEIRAGEERQQLEHIMQLLKDNDIDINALVAAEADETNEVAQEEPETAFPVSAPVEDGDDGSAPS